MFASHLDSDNIEEIQDFLNESVKSKKKLGEIFHKCF